VGKFVEVEVVADESAFDAAQAAVLAAAADLGLTTPEPRSYLRMLLEK
jgi:adenylate cyclase class IV